MLSSFRLRHALVPAALAVLCLAAEAQLAVSEVLYDPLGVDLGQQVIEIHNFSAAPEPLWIHTVCVGGSGPGIPTNNCFTLPGLTLPAGAHLQVHWNASGVSTPTDVYTGPGLDPLEGPIGSVSIFGLGTSLTDYVQWGGDAFGIFQAAFQGEWTTGTWVAPSAEGHTLAFDGSGDAPNDWFEDQSPTLGSANTLPGNPASALYGSGCPGTPGVPKIGTDFGPPALGNLSFTVRVANALVGSTAICGISTAKLTLPLLGCTLKIDPTQPGFVIMPPQPVAPDGVAALPAPIPHKLGLVGVTVYLQAVVFDPGAPEVFAFTRGLEVQL
jgi:hypothetical protein